MDPMGIVFVLPFFFASSPNSSVMILKCFLLKKSKKSPVFRNWGDFETSDFFRLEVVSVQQTGDDGKARPGQQC